MSKAGTRGAKRASLNRLRASRCRRSLATFVKMSWKVLAPTTPLVWNWHHDALCLHVQEALEGWMRAKGDPTYVQKIRDLLVNVPPGTLKSRIVSVCAVAWMWTRDPSCQFICASGNEGVAARDSIYCRRLIRSNWYRETFEPKWEITGDQDEKLLYHNTAGGFRSAQSMSGAWTGDRADVVIIDDPNDAKKVFNEAHRTEINERVWDQAASGRVNSPQISLRIGIMQRLHERDWSGHVLSKPMEDDGLTRRWVHLVIPLFYEVAKRRETDCEKRGCNCLDAETVIGWRDPRTVEGEVIHPARFTPEAIAIMRTDLGSYGMAGQGQQRPSPEGGGMFRRENWRFVSPDGSPLPGRRPAGCYSEAPLLLPREAEEFQIISLDANFKSKSKTKGKEPDWACFLVLARVGARMFVFDMRRCRGMTATKAMLRQLDMEYPHAYKKLIEDTANGTAILEELAEDIPGLEGVTPQGGPEARAWAMQPSQESGNWFLLDGAPWLEDFVGEFDAFPAGRFNDIVAAASQGWSNTMPGDDASRLAMLVGSSRRR